jgi:hypothetical protein
MSGSLADISQGVAGREVQPTAAQEFAASCREQQQASGLCSPQRALPPHVARVRKFTATILMSSRVSAPAFQDLNRSAASRCYPSGFGDFAGAGGLFWGCAFTS